ncbi:hypothetical protein K788_0000687 [Paraburkholderia caribensis MBA4]|uniref:Uncharacterized protein n=1 Tax=Paraburkholderia caribensis MBA4 TaxID=1323664 RepID=A0A0N7JV47_9BURK|nr:hypothetical protein K788_0000687 [Paraburkholderia caribensis MBA4]
MHNARAYMTLRAIAPTYRQNRHDALPHGNFCVLDDEG